jgi:hypothetical protein
VFGDAVKKITYVTLPPPKDEGLLLNMNDMPEFQAGLTDRGVVHDGQETGGIGHHDSPDLDLPKMAERARIAPRPQP